MVPISGATTEQGHALSGDWGGNQVRLSLTDSGGRIDLGCAAIGFDSPIRPDATGHFSISANHEAFSGGPTLADAKPTMAPVLLNGHVEGDILHLTIDHGSRADPEVFSLQRGRRVKIIRCN